MKNPTKSAKIHSTRVAEQTNNPERKAAENRPLDILLLEPRILFSGSPAPAPAPPESSPEPPSPEVLEPVQNQNSVSESGNSHTPSGDEIPTVAEPQTENSNAIENQDSLDEKGLASIVEAATQRWIESGISDEQIQALEKISYSIEDLGDNRLGVAEGYSIIIDDDAGSGTWFIDPTPDTDEEYIPNSGNSSVAVPDSEAFGKLDLLSTVIHEQGHVLGLYDVSGSGNDVMNGVLSSDQRRLPWEGQAEGATPGSLEGAHYLVTTWTPIGTIEGENAADNAGWSIATSNDGDTVIIGAISSNDGGLASGHARVFRWDGNSWNQLGGDIAGESAADLAGFSVDMSADGNTVVIGAPENGLTGHARIFRFDGNDWNQLGTDINGEGLADLSGTSVAMSEDGNTVVIGAPDNTLSRGHARVYRFDGTDWNQLGSDINGQALSDLFGTSVDISADGNSVVVGAPGHGLTRGNARIFDWNGSAWTQRGADIDGEFLAHLAGTSVAITADGDSVIVGSPGNSLLFGNSRIFDWDGTGWTQRGGAIQGEFIADLAGSAVDISDDGNMVVIGAPEHNLLGGQVRAFRWTGTSWVQHGSDLEGVLPIRTGSSVAISGDGETLAFGSPESSINGLLSGRADIVRLLFTTEVRLEANGDMTITDVLGGDTPDDLTIVVDGTDYHVTDPAHSIDRRIPIASVTGDIIFNTLDADDTITINYSGGDFLHNIIVNGGNNDTPFPGDQLVLTGGAFNAATYNYVNGNEGSIQLTGQGVITYAELESLSSEIDAADVTLNYSDAPETITVANAGTGRVEVDSTAGGITSFNNPSGSFTINAGGGADTLDFDSLDPGFAADLIINGDGGTDSVNINGGLDSGALASLSVAAEHTNIGANISTTGNQAYDGNVSFTGDSILTATSLLFLGGTTTFGGGDTTFDVTGAATSQSGNTLEFQGGSLNLANGSTFTSFGSAVFQSPGQFELGGGGQLVTGNGGVTTLDGMVSSLDGSTMRVADGGLLEGSGSFSGEVIVDSGGTVSPGPNVGIIGTGDLNLNGIYDIDIGGGDGAGVANGHDQIGVTGIVLLDGTTAILNVDTTDVSAGELSGGDELVIIDNDLADQVTGTFSNYAEGDIVATVAGGLDLVLTYQGGDGNDVALLVRDYTTRVYVSGANLVIEDINDATADDITLTVVGSNLVITEADTDVRIDAQGVLEGATGEHTNQVTIPLASFTGDIIFEGHDADDTFTVDFSGGDFLNDIVVIGGDNDTPFPGDQLVLAGGAFDAAAFNFANLGEGSIQLSGQGLISYSELEFINSEVDAGDVTLNYGDAPETISVTDAGAGRVGVDSTAGGITSFNNPTDSLTINAGGGADTLNFDSLDPGFAADLIISGDGGTDSVNINGGLGSGALAALTVEAENIALNSSITTTGDQTYGGDVGFNGSNTLTAANISFQGGTTTFDSGDTVLDVTGAATSHAGNTLDFQGGSLVLANVSSFTSLGSAVFQSPGGFELSGGGELVTGDGGVTTLDSTVSSFDGSTLRVADGGLLEGTGSFSGGVIVDEGGAISPGPNAASLDTGDLDLSGIYYIDVDGGDGAGVPNGHDQIGVTGAVLLDSATSVLIVDTLDVSSGELAGGDELVIINNDHADLITGTFSNFAEGEVVATVAGGLDLVLTYQGGDGNDVALLVRDFTTRVYLSGNDLIIEDVNDATADNLTLTVAGGNLVITDADTGVRIDAQGVLDGSPGDLTNQVTIPLTSFTGNVVLELNDLADTINIEGLVLPDTRGLVVNGGAGADTANFQSSSSTLEGGSVTVDAEIINFSVDVDSAAGDQSYDGAVVLGASVVLTAENVTLGGTTSLGAETLTIDVSGDEGQASGGVSGSGSIIKAGDGTFTLGAESAYSGGTVISQGTIVLNDDGGAGTGTITLNDANTGAGDTALYAAGDVDPGNDIVVSNQGTGVVRIGSNGTGISDNIFTGNIQLNRETTLTGDQGITEFTGVISGNPNLVTIGRSLDIVGPSTGRVSWVNNNTFDGDVDIKAGAILQAGGGGNNQIPTCADVNIDADGFLWVVFDDESIDGLTGEGTVTLHPGGGGGATTLTVGECDADAQFDGVIADAGGTPFNLVKTGAGTQILTGNYGYTGSTQVNGGTLLVNGTHDNAGDYTVSDGATLGGTGDINGTVFVQPDGSLAPGVDGPGVISTDDLNLDGNFDVEIAGTTGAGTAGGHDQAAVTGSVALGDDAVLNLSILDGFTPSTGFTFNIIDNDGTDAVSGFFLNPETGTQIEEGHAFNVGDQVFTISYQGGDGNDVSITAHGIVETDGFLENGFGTLVDVNGGITDDDLVFSINGDYLQVHELNPNTPISMSGTGVIRPDAYTILVPLALLDDFQVDLLLGDDTLIIEDLAGYNANTSIDTGGGFDVISHSSNGEIILTGANGVTYTQVEKVVMNSGSMLSTEDGGIVFEANLGGAGGSFTSIEIDNATLTTARGEIALTGQGGTTGTLRSGILIENTSVVNSGGALTMIGTGGGSSSSAIGVNINNSSVTSSSLMNLVGTGAFGGVGVNVVNNADLNSAGGLTVTGIGGVDVNQAQLTSEGGSSISIYGSGSIASTNYGYGVELNGATVVSSGTVDIDGFGSNGLHYGTGVFARASSIQAVGDLAVRGAGGAANPGSGNLNTGVTFDVGSTLSSNVGSVTIAGTGGNGQSNNYGVYMNGIGSIGAASGISIVGTGAGSGGGGRGVYLTNGVLNAGGGVLSIIGTASQSGAGSVVNTGIEMVNITATAGGGATIVGSGGAGTNNNNGVNLKTFDLESGGDILIAGTGGDASGSTNSATLLDFNTTVETTGGSITITGVAQGGVNYNAGVSTNRDLVLASTNGVTIEGTGAGTGSFNRGVLLANSANIDGGSGNVEILGVGTQNHSANGSSNIGVEISRGTTQSGAVTSVIGVGGNGLNSNAGISLKTASITSEFNVIVDGTGGFATGQSNTGILADFGSSITSNSGSAALAGSSTSGTNFNYGVSFARNSTVKGLSVSVSGDASGSGQWNSGIWISTGSMTALGGTLEINGSGGDGTDYNYGVYTVGLATSATSDISIVGNGGNATGNSNMGVAFLNGSSAASSTGSLSINGAAIGGASNNAGVYLANNGSMSGNSGVSIEGTGAGVGGNGRGVHIVSGGAINAGSGNLSIVGRGTVSETTGNSNSGVEIATLNASAGGAISVSGTGGSGVSANYGVSLKSVSLNSAGDVSINGIAGTGTGVNNSGVSLSNGTSVTSAGGSIALVGTAGGGTNSNSGVYVHQATIDAGSGTVTLIGTGAGTGTWNTGVTLSSSTLLGSTASVAGTGGDGDSTNFGAYINALSGSTLTPGDVTTDPDDSSEKGGDFFNLLPVAPFLIAGASRRNGGKRERVEKVSVGSLQFLADRSFAFAKPDSEPISSQDIIVIVENNSPFAIGEKSIERVLGEETVAIGPDPVEDMCRALIFLELPSGSYQLFWSLISPDGTLSCSEQCSLEPGRSAVDELTRSKGESFEGCPWGGFDDTPRVSSDRTLDLLSAEFHRICLMSD